MQGTPNAERLMKNVKVAFEINDENYNRAYSICMGMKIVYATERIEFDYLCDLLFKAGFKLRGK